MNNEQLLKVFIINNIMPEKKLREYVQFNGHLPINTESGWRKAGYRVIRAAAKKVAIPDCLSLAEVIQAEKDGATDCKNKALRDYISDKKSAEYHAAEESEFAMYEIPLWRKIDGKWGQYPTRVYSRRQVEKIEQKESYGSVADLRKRLAVQNAKIFWALINGELKLD